MTAFPSRPEFPALIEKFGNTPPVSSRAGLGSFRTRKENNS